MLVLSRLIDQEIKIGEDIIVKVVEVRGHRVRLGIVAPASVPVHRAEIIIKRPAMDSKKRTNSTGPGVGRLPAGNVFAIGNP